MAALQETFSTKAWGARAAGEPITCFEIPRRKPSPHDIHIRVDFAGICHSDIHQAREEWGKASFPMVPGHEIGGTVVDVGAKVTKFKVGDKAGVGCMVDSCRSCSSCRKGKEQYCKTGPVFTYNSTEKYEHCPGYGTDLGKYVYGGYSKDVVVSESYACVMPSNLDLAAATPLLCAGITVYSPMKSYGLQPGSRFAIAGLGGLGHMAVKFAKAFGCHVTVISRGTGKKDEALKNLKAHSFVDSTNADEMKAAAESFDFILDCIAADHDIEPYMALLDVGGKMVMVGLPSEKVAMSAFSFVARQKSLCGSMIGGIEETQEMLDFCGLHGIVCDIEMTSADKINECYERTIKSDVKYRFVIDANSM